MAANDGRPQCYRFQASIDDATTCHFCGAAEATHSLVDRTPAAPSWPVATAVPAPPIDNAAVTKRAKTKSNTCCRLLSYGVYLFFLAYVGLLVYHGTEVLFPQLFMKTHDEITGAPLPNASPTWFPGMRFNVSAVVLLKGDGREWRAWDAPNVEFTSDMHASIRFANLSTAPMWLTSALENNRVPFVRFSLASNRFRTERVEVPLVVYRRPLRRLVKPTRKLVEGWPVLGSLFPSLPKPVPGVAASKSNSSIGFWQPRVGVHVVWDFTNWTLGQVPPLVARAIRIDNAQYTPIVSGAQMGLQQQEMVQVNVTNAEALPLEFAVDTMALPRWMVQEFFDQGLESHRRAGVLQEEDLDDVKRMITAISPMVLAVTILVSVVHVMFDVLAFKAEIGYWRALSSARGVSTRSLVLATASQAVIFLYLVDQDATKLVVLPTGVGVLVSAWKVVRSLSLPGHAAEQTQSDAYALRVMGAVLAPLVIAYCFLTLVRDEYASWYSYVVSALAMSVYAGGFALMTPQVFLNYKLKSVSHLAWDALIYRAFNTFIDDWFAFVMPLPNMHRIMTLRDDVVFIVFMVQRYIYPVRPAEADDDALATVAAVAAAATGEAKLKAE